MSEDSTILYLGADLDFFNQLKNFCEKKKKKAQVVVSLYHKGCIVNLVTNASTSIVFFDMTEMSYALSEVISEVSFIKKHPLLKGVLFVGVLADKQDEENSEILLSSGFQYLFIKGCETEILFKDCFYIHSSDEIPVNDFAKAKDINRPILAGFNSSLTALGEENFLIETDFLPDGSQLDLNLSLFPDLKATSYQIKQQQNSCTQYPMTYTFLMQYPFAKPWDEVTNAFLPKETVKSWLSDNAEILTPEKKTVWIISTNKNLLNKFFELSLTFPYYLHISNDLSVDGAPPIMVFIDLEDQEDSLISLNKVLFLIDNLKARQKKPFIVLLNAKSSTSALQKVLSYNQLIATTEKMTADMVNGLSLKLYEKYKSQTGHQLFSIISTEKRRPIDIFSEVTLTSLSEHEITFFTPTEIPMFSVMHFTIPINFFATIVPTYKDLKRRENQIHYLALIHGISEDHLKHLRQFINQIIYSPLKDYSKKNILSFMDEIYKGRTTKPVDQQLEVQPVLATISPVEVKKESIRRINGKSKL